MANVVTIIVIFQDFELKEVEIEGPPYAPVAISIERRHKTWFHKDDVFEQPECFIYFHILRCVSIIKLIYKHKISLELPK